MERVGAWLWREHRRHFVLYGALAVIGILGPLLIIPALLVGSLSLDLTLEAGLLFSSLAFLGVLLGLVVTTFVVRRRLRSLAAWVAGDERDPTGAWSDLMRLPLAVGVRVPTTVVPIAFVTSFPVAVAVVDEPAIGLVGLAYAYLLVGLAGQVLVTAVAQLLVRAAVTEVAHLVGPVEVEERRTWTIRRRLILGTFVGASFAAVAAPLAVFGTAPEGGDYTALLLLGGVMAVYLCVLMDVGMFQPTLAPVRDLVAGMVRVRRGQLDEPVPITSPDELGGLAAAFNEMQAGLRQRQALHAAFGSYVDPALAERVLQSGSAVFDGEEVVVSVFFADVRDFTAYSEGVEPVEAVQLLNRLFDAIVPIIHEHGGHANHYLGDGLLAVFGAPNPLERHADAAVAAAIAMQRAARDELGEGVRLGIGVNSGPVIAGTVGGGGRHEFTVIGDTVNVAARVEQLTKDTRDTILITEQTRAALSPPRPRSTRRGDFAVRGKASKVRLHAIDPWPRRAAPGGTRSAARRRSPAQASAPPPRASRRKA